MTKVRAVLRLLWAVTLTISVGCSRKDVSLPPSTPQVSRNNRSYIDLQPGMTVHVVVPLLKSGEFRSDLVEQKAEGNTISLRASNLVGYTNSSYMVTGKPRSVHLTFVSAQETRDGKPTMLPAPPGLPFQLPPKSELVRLVFLVRVSQADHNMAVLGAKRLELLDAFTKRLMDDPSICSGTGEVFCSWVPAGVAVRPEK